MFRPDDDMTPDEYMLDYDPDFLAKHRPKKKRVPDDGRCHCLMCAMPDTMPVKELIIENTFNKIVARFND